jgi:cobalt-zinc-cadmium efflux system protein
MNQPGNFQKQPFIFKRDETILNGLLRHIITDMLQRIVGKGVLKKSDKGKMMSHHHDHSENAGDQRLIVSVAINILLTVAQVAGGILANSLSLIADALHNFSDAAALGIALFARRIGRKPADHLKTFGYQRAELIAALINLTTLIIIGLYLVYEAVFRFIQPEPVAGWIVIIVAGIALVVDLITAILTYSQSKESMNIKAAFLHNVSDALSSVGVIVAGVAIIYYGWYWADALLTLIIAGYVLYQGFSLMPKTIHILMEGAPDQIDIHDLMQTIKSVGRINDVHHVHVWRLDEYRNALEAHVVVQQYDLKSIEIIKKQIKDVLRDRYGIAHSTLEFEISGTECE